MLTNFSEEDKEQNDPDKGAHVQDTGDHQHQN